MAAVRQEKYRFFRTRVREWHSTLFIWRLYEDDTIGSYSERRSEKDGRTARGRRETKDDATAAEQTRMLREVLYKIINCTRTLTPVIPRCNYTNL